MTDDTWIEEGQTISTAEELRAYVSDLRAAVHHMQTGLGRAAWGALQGSSWVDTPGDDRPTHDNLLRDHLNMTATPAGTTAKDAVLRQSMATLLVAMDAVDRATLTVWLADVNSRDPERLA